MKIQPIILTFAITLILVNDSVLFFFFFLYHIDKTSSMSKLAWLTLLSNLFFIFLFLLKSSSRLIDSHLALAVSCVTFTKFPEHSEHLFLHFMK